LKIGEIDLGLKMLSSLTVEDMENLEMTHPYGYFAYASLLAKAKLSGSHLFNQEVFSAIADRAINFPEAEHLQTAVREIKEVLAE
jgi:hypothetical protein